MYTLPCPGIGGLRLQDASRYYGDPTPYSGRLEFQTIIGEWGAVCGIIDTFSVNTICKTFGWWYGGMAYNGSRPITSFNAIGNLTCGPNAANISQCTYSTAPADTNCTNVAYIECNTGKPQNQGRAGLKGKRGGAGISLAIYRHGYVGRCCKPVWVLKDYNTILGACTTLMRVLALFRHARRGRCSMAHQ